MKKYILLSVIFGVFLFLVTSKSCSTTKHQKNKYLTEEQTGYKRHLDLPYAYKSKAQKLDIYIPNKIKYKYPIIIAIHGGAFLSGDKSMLPQMAMIKGIEKGFAVIGINYRLSTERKFPAQIEDVKSAIIWIKENADKYHLDRNKIVLWGASAGAHLASLAGTTHDLPIFQDPSIISKYDASVNLVIDWFGPINFLSMDAQLLQSRKGKAIHHKKDSPESKLMGLQISKDPELVRLSNPECYISKNDPPFFIQHGTLDPLVPFQQSTFFYHRLRGVLGSEKVILKLIDGAKHGGMLFDLDENIKLTFSVIEQYIK